MCVDFILGPTFSYDVCEREELCARARDAGVIVTVILKSMCSVASALEKRPLKSTDRMQNKKKIRTNAGETPQHRMHILSYRLEK